MQPLTKPLGMVWHGMVGPAVSSCSTWTGREKGQEELIGTTDEDFA